MAYRAAARTGPTRLIALAGDVPPDVAASTRVPLPPILIGRGARDDMYTAAGRRGRRHAPVLGVEVESCVFDGAHEWTADFYAARAAFSARLI